jgi:predicted transcriptional regulator
VKREPLAIKTKHTQVKIADTIGVSQPTVSYWLKMKSKPTGLQRKALEQHFPDLLQRIDEAWMGK